MPDANITKKALATSMQKLMIKKDFEKISVTDICDMCGMNRKSFYYHFKDKYDLVNWIFYTEFITLVSSRQFENGWDLFRTVIDLFQNEQNFYRKALEIEGQNSFRDYFYESMFPIFSLFMQYVDSRDRNLETNIRYLCDAFLTIMHRWLVDGCRQTPEEFIESIRSILVNLSKHIL